MPEGTNAAPREGASLVRGTMVLMAALSIAGCAPQGPRYEVVEQPMTWVDAAAYAHSQGGRLAEVTSAAELKAVRAAVEAARVDPSSTVAPDGGNGAYLWLGGNDLAQEGRWLWDGDNDGQGTPFWKGQVEGLAVDDAFTAWGYEPDDYLDHQDALALSLNGWPLGSAGQWNDVDADNKLFFIVEY